jgi:hypothetical protein
MTPSSGPSPVIAGAVDFWAVLQKGHAKTEARTPLWRPRRGFAACSSGGKNRKIVAADSPTGACPGRSLNHGGMAPEWPGGKPELVERVDKTNRVARSNSNFQTHRSGGCALRAAILRLSKDEGWPPARSRSLVAVLRDARFAGSSGDVADKRFRYDSNDAHPAMTLMEGIAAKQEPPASLQGCAGGS